MTDQSMTQQAFTTILEHFVATGRAPHYSELADLLSVDVEEARELQRAAVAAAPICELLAGSRHGSHRVLGSL